MILCNVESKKQLTFTNVISVQNVQLSSALYIFLIKIVMNLVLICVFINKALDVSLNMEVKVVEAQRFLLASAVDFPQPLQ
jgi:hypothetical protein